MSIGYFIGETEELRELADKWTPETRGEDFGFDISSDNALKEFEVWRDNSENAIIVSIENERIVGCLCIYAIDSMLIGKRIAIVKYWFVAPEFRRGIRMYNEAQNWTIENGCSHLMFYCSNLGSGRYERMSSLFRRLGMKLFESTFMKEV